MTRTASKQHSLSTKEANYYFLFFVLAFVSCSWLGFLKGSANEATSPRLLRFFIYEPEQFPMQTDKEEV